MILSEAVLAVLMPGMTHYIDIGGEADAAIYYADRRTAHMRLAPDGPVTVGAWTLHADGYSVAWEDGRQGRWAIEAEDGRFTYLDGEGKARGTVTRFVPGDAAGLVSDRREK